MKKCDHHISDLHKQIANCYAFVEKAQKALTEKQRDQEMKIQQLEIKLSNKKLEDMHSRNSHRLVMISCCVDLYNQAQFKWFEEMVTTKSWNGGKWRGWRLSGNISTSTHSCNTRSTCSTKTELSLL
ncbi:Growth arrest-specific protein 7 [Sciurus carolinensis]|uniref:Growth arrest-specific protein 7 n=1 Tax=Sciurus carolinensis TaxID=30640 RepID=A0AA41N0N3_SCICA|nr:Growth arrest-specific protein 7 [Sciurus carolinensis]